MLSFLKNQIFLYSRKTALSLLVIFTIFALVACSNNKSKDKERVAVKGESTPKLDIKFSKHLYTLYDMPSDTLAELASHDLAARYFMYLGSIIGDMNVDIGSETVTPDVAMERFFENTDIKENIHNVGLYYYYNDNFDESLKYLETSYHKYGNVLSLFFLYLIEYEKNGLSDKAKGYADISLTFSSEFPEVNMMMIEKLSTVEDVQYFITLIKKRDTIISASILGNIYFAPFRVDQDIELAKGYFLHVLELNSESNALNDAIADDVRKNVIDGTYRDLVTLYVTEGDMENAEKYAELGSTEDANLYNLLIDIYSDPYSVSRYNWDAEKARKYLSLSDLDERYERRLLARVNRREQMQSKLPDNEVTQFLAKKYPNGIACEWSNQRLGGRIKSIIDNEGYVLYDIFKKEITEYYLPENISVAVNKSVTVQNLLINTTPINFLDWYASETSGTNNPNESDYVAIGLCYLLDMSFNEDEESIKYIVDRYKRHVSSNIKANNGNSFNSGDNVTGGGAPE